MFFAIGASRLAIKTIFSDLFPATHPLIQTYKDHPNFGNPLTVTLMVKRADGKSRVMDGAHPYWSWATVHAFNVQTKRMRRIE